MPQRRRSFTHLRWLGLLLGAAGLTGLAPMVLADSDITIHVRQDTYVLTDLSKLAGESSAKSAERTADLALGALNAEAAALAKEDAKLANDVAEFKKTHDAAQQELNSKTEEYKRNLSGYKARISAYNQTLTAYDAEVSQQSAQVAASNSLPATKRNPSTVNYLNTWKGRLDQQKAVLDTRKEKLDSERSTLDTQLAALDRFQKEKETALAALLEPLKERASQLKFREGEAYRQLKQCQEYALAIRKLLSTQYNIETSTASTNLRSAEERLKELSNSGFDGNTSKPPLVERKKDSEFFKQR